MAIFNLCHSRVCRLSLNFNCSKKKEKRKLQEYRAGTWQPVHEQEGQETGAEPDVPKLFEKKYPNDIIQIIHEFLRLALVATLAYYVSVWTAPFVTISPFCAVFMFLA